MGAADNRKDYVRLPLVGVELGLSAGDGKPPPPAPPQQGTNEIALLF